MNDLKGILRKMGYLSDSRGIIDRYIDVNGEWEEHLTQCRQFITGSLSGREIQNLAVYGSGWQLDLPLDELSSMAAHIMLYDVVHPAQVLHRLRRYNNVKAITADITGGVINAAYNAVSAYNRTRVVADPEQICAYSFAPEVRPDYALSLNILSQIGDIVTDYLKKHMPYSEDDISRMVYLLQESHLKLLKLSSSLLITDIREECYDSADQLKTTKDVIKCSLPVSGKIRTWKWQLDPLGEYNPGMKTVSTVIGMEL